MITLISNIHPVFVHFTVALISLAFLTTISTYFVGDDKKQRLLDYALISLYLGALFTVATVATGLYAFGTVKHDTLSHMAMVNHRNWAIPTAILILIGAALVYTKRKKTLAYLLPIVLVILTTMVIITSFKGGELVYRYGLGVMSIPQASEEGQNHEHGNEKGEEDQHNDGESESHNH